MNCLLVPALLKNYFISLSDLSLFHLKYSRGSRDFRANYGFWKAPDSFLPLHLLSVWFYVWVSVVHCPEVISYWESLLSKWCWYFHRKVCFCLKGTPCYSSLAKMIISLSINHRYFKTIPVCFSGKRSLGLEGVEQWQFWHMQRLQLKKLLSVVFLRLGQKHSDLASC